MAEQSTSETIAEIWKLFRETAQQMRETDERLDQRFRETDERLDQRFRETDERLDQRFRETDERFRETDERLNQHFRETDDRLNQHFRETDKRISKHFSETSTQLRKLEGLFTTQWGRLLEALVKPGALKLFQSRGLAVHRIHERSEARLNGDTKEIDLILTNDTELVAIEVKTTLTVTDISEFLQDLADFTTYFPVYRNFRIYGAVAAINIAENADRYAYKQGLFVLTLTGDDLVEIRNDTRFRPLDFNAGAVTKNSHV